MNIDGTNTLACTKNLNDINGDVGIYPLPHRPVVKDLVPDLDQLYSQLASIEPWLKTDSPAPHASGSSRSRTAPSSMGWGVYPVFLLLHGLPVLLVERRPLPWASYSVVAYRWPQTAAMKHRQRLDALEDPFRLYRCHTIELHQTSQGLNPAKAITEIRR